VVHDFRHEDRIEPEMTSKRRRCTLGA